MNVSKTTDRLPASLLLVVTTLLISSCGGLRLDGPLRHSSQDWPTFGGNNSRTNFAPDKVHPPLSLSWEHDITGGVGNGSPLVIDSMVLVGNLRGELYVISAHTGKRAGWVSLGDAIQGSPVVDLSTAYVAVSNSSQSLVSFDLVEGKARWKREYGDIEVSPLLLGRRIYVGNTAGTFFCVDREKGDRVWQFELPQNTKGKGIRSSPASDSTTVLFGAEDGSLYALDVETGKLQWSFQSGAPIFATPTMTEEMVYVGNMNGRFMAIDVRTGSLKWDFKTTSSIHASASVAGEMVIIGTTGGRLFGLESGGGRNIWTLDVDGVVNSAPCITGNIAYVGTLKKELFAIDVSTGRVVWKETVPGRIKTSPAAALGKIFVATDERLILAFDGAK